MISIIAIEKELIDIYIKIGIDMPSNHLNILQFAKEDIEASADPKKWHSGDVAIAFRRFLEKKEE